MSYQDEAECMETGDLLDEVIDLAQGDSWDGMFTAAGGRKFDAFKDVLVKRIDTLKAQVEQLSTEKAQVLLELTNVQDQYLSAEKDWHLLHSRFEQFQKSINEKLSAISDMLSFKNKD